MFIKIWKRTIIPSFNGTALICDSPISDRFSSKEEAVTALEELADNKFNMSRYHRKQVLSVKKDSSRMYTIVLKDDTKEIYYIP